MEKEMFFVEKTANRNLVLIQEKDGVVKMNCFNPLLPLPARESEWVKPLNMLKIYGKEIKLVNFDNRFENFMQFPIE